MTPWHGLGSAETGSSPVRSASKAPSRGFFVVMFYVYILKSLSDGSFYKGYTEDYVKRLEEHNSGLSKYTATKTPWILFYVEMQPTKKDAIIRERKLKRCKADYFLWLTQQQTNILLK